MTANRQPGGPASDGAGLDDLFRRVTEVLATSAVPLCSTYRIQFNTGFTFRDAAAIVPYLAALGVSHLYASPYLKARPGSMHGYDIADHGSLNPEIGSEADYEAMVETLHAHGMGQLLDVVPNHMGIAGSSNAWWADVLESGPGSPHAGFFDIDWDPIKPELRNTVLLPVLGDQYGRVLENQELVLAFEQGGFWITYHEHRWPIAPETFTQLLELRIDELTAALGPDNPALQEYRSVITAVNNLPRREETDPARVAERQREKEVIKRRLAALCEAEPEVCRFVEENVRIFNGTRGDPRSFDRLDRLLTDQAYRLSYWRVAAEEINYRRFFDINDLAALRMDNPAVFEATHRLVLDLLARGRVDGLRIDHPDGLFDPRGYFRALQRARVRQVGEQLLEEYPDADGDGREARLAALLARFDALLDADPAAPDARPLFTVVEKILGPGEPLPESWPVSGTVGYEYLNALGGLFVDASRAAGLDELYARIVGDRVSFPDLVYECKKLIMRTSMASETNVLGQQLNRRSERNRWSRDFTLYSLTQAIREIIACFPVYRTYINGAADEVSDRDRAYIELAVQRAKRRNPAGDPSIFDFVRDVLLLRFPDSLGEEDRALQRDFVMKFQQVTGPVMARGLEDTAFYRYNRLVSLNEVGGNPEQVGVPPEAFHRLNRERLERWPGSLAATSTHDTKRSEDVRARIHVLSEVAMEWRTAVSLWRRLNRRKKALVDGQPAPDANDEYLLYQTLVGSWPLGEVDAAALAAYRERIQDYMTKATREARVNTSWINPNAEYDAAVRGFVAAILEDTPANRFLPALRAFQARIVPYGLLNALAQTVLKLASPGVPDVYQGTELWDLSLVDPDNRRPVDYATRRALLEGLRERIAASGGDLVTLARGLAERLTDGAVKLYVIHRGLTARQEHPELFARGAYLPITAEGARAAYVVAFARVGPGARARTAVAVAPRLSTRLTRGPAELPLGEGVWGDTWLPLPPEVATRRFLNRFTGERVEATERGGQPALPLAAVLANFPVALLLEEATS